jgi:uncharacterized protein (DUF1330 family)
MSISTLILLSRLQNWNNVEIQIRESDTIIIQLEIKQDPKIITSGYCDIINNQLIAVFSNQGKNFLSMDGKLVELTNNIAIEYHVAQFEDKESWFKIYNNNELLFAISYINPHKPFILPDPFAYDEDYNTTNFAHHLAGYINKVRENPSIILFNTNENLV